MSAAATGERQYLDLLAQVLERGAKKTDQIGRAHV